MPKQDKVKEDGKAIWLKAFKDLEREQKKEETLTQHTGTDI